jgi:hypothetical protein
LGSLLLGPLGGAVFESSFAQVLATVVDQSKRRSALLSAALISLGFLVLFSSGSLGEDAQPPSLSLRFSRSARFGFFGLPLLFDLSRRGGDAGVALPHEEVVGLIEVLFPILAHCLR